MSTNYFAIVAPCEHCGMSQERPIHFGKSGANYFTLHTGAYFDEANVDTVFLDSQAKWRAFLRRKDVVVRDEYRQVIDKATVAKLWRRYKGDDIRSWFR